MHDYIGTSASPQNALFSVGASSKSYETIEADVTTMARQVVVGMWALCCQNLATGVELNLIDSLLPQLLS